MPSRATAAVPTPTQPGASSPTAAPSRVAPENTLTAFRIAAQQGARWIEFDASLLGDGTAVLHHDDTLDRCTDASGPLAGLSAAYLGLIDAGSWFGPDFAGEPLVTLDQALDLIDALSLSANLEMKPHDAPPEAMARAVTEALRRRPWARRRILVSSFDLAALAALRRLMPEQPLAMLYEDPPADWPSVLAALNACSLHIQHDCLTDGILARAAAERVHVRV